MDKESHPIVTVEQGKLKGKINQTANGQVYYSFNGIPYAEAPEGKLRFKDPVPKSSWSGIRDATQEGEMPPQCEIYTDIYRGSDDCLFLNVNTPQLRPSKKLAVMVYIHGGGFAEGSGNVYDFVPDYIVEQDTILVSMNYRLGVLGFLCTDPVNARGDMGLKDQSLALKWVKQNIEAFGGDNDNITIFGVSAGGASVEYHVLSPMSKGLFHKAIMHSGSVLNPWARSRGAVEHARRLAEIFGYNSDSSEGLFEFINKIDSESLVRATFKMMDDPADTKKLKFRGMPFTPAINELEGYDGFLNEEPELLLKTGRFPKIPIISGFCDGEGIFMYNLYYNNEEIRSDLSKLKFYDYIPYFMNKNIPQLEDKLRTIYRPSVEDSNEHDYIMNYLSDFHFAGGILHSLRLRSNHGIGNQYLFYFMYDGNLNVEKIIAPFQEARACHADDMGYLSGSLNPEFLASKPNATDLKVRSRMVKMWTNFAKTGNPTPVVSDLINVKWLPVENKENLRYLEIGADLKMKENLFPERMKLWLNIHADE